MADLFLCSKKCGKLEGPEAAPKSRIPLGCTCSQVPSVANAPDCKHCTVKPLCRPLWDPGWCYWLSSTSGWINLPAAANSTEKTGWFGCTCCRIESPGISPVSVWWQSSQTRPWQYCWLWAVEPVSISIVHCWILCWCWILFVYLWLLAKEHAVADDRTLSSTLILIHGQDLYAMQFKMIHYGELMQLWNVGIGWAIGDSAPNWDYTSTRVNQSTGPSTEHQFLVKSYPANSWTALNRKKHQEDSIQPLPWSPAT